MAPIRCSGLNLDHILDGFNGQRVCFPITYLGLPLTLGQLKIENCSGTPFFFKMARILKQLIKEISYFYLICCLCYGLGLACPTRPQVQRGNGGLIDEASNALRLFLREFQLQRYFVLPNSPASSSAMARRGSCLTGAACLMARNSDGTTAEAPWRSTTGFGEE